MVDLELRNWRIVVMTFIEDEAIVIYPDVVIHGKRHASLEDAIAWVNVEMIRQQMFK